MIADVNGAEMKAEIARTREQSYGAKKHHGKRETRSWRHHALPVIRYAIAVLLVSAAFFTMLTVRDSFPATTFQTPLFFCSIVLSGWFAGLGPGILATVLSMFAIKFYFTAPPHNLAFPMSEIPGFTVFFLVGSFVSWLSFRQRRDEEMAREAIIAKERQEAEKAKATALADERNRLAADVHDTLAQAFAATLLHLRSMEMARLEPDLRSHCQFAQQTASAGLAAARRAMNVVRTAAPADNRPLTERLAERVRRLSARTAAQVDFHVEGKIAVLLWAVEDEIERLATEALFNAERHAAASKIIVKLEYLPEPGLRLRVHDDGRGFDQTQVIGGGLGLRAMHERAERIGATFTLVTESGQGTEVIVLWMSEGTNTGPETNRLKGRYDHI
jgi:signal transduction histidine kinase